MTTSNPENSSPIRKAATEHRISRYLGIVLLVGVMMALMQGAALALPGWLLAVPFLLLGWVEAGEFLIADFRFLNGVSGMQNQKSGRAAAAKAAAGSVVYHAVLAAVVIVGHGQMAKGGATFQVAQAGGQAGCGCGAKSAATGPAAQTSNGKTGGLPRSGNSGCGCGSGSGSGCGCGAGKAAAGGSQSQPATASGCG